MGSVLLLAAEFKTPNGGHEFAMTGHSSHAATRLFSLLPVALVVSLNTAAAGRGGTPTIYKAEIVQADLRFLDADTFQERKRIRVTLNGGPPESLNELEWVNGEVLANVWRTDWIDPTTGKFLGVIDRGVLLGQGDEVVSVDPVLNGIAYDAAADRLFATGKNRLKLFEIRLRPIAPTPRKTR